MTNNSPPPSGTSPNTVSSTTAEPKSVIDTSSERLRLRRKFRHLVDKSASVAIAIGGISVIVAIMLIFFYLFYEVMPLFSSAEVEESSSFQLEVGEGTPLHLAIEEQSQFAMSIADSGDVSFFDLASGALVDEIALSIPAGERITDFALSTEESGIFGLALDSGKALVAQYSYATSYDSEGTRILTPTIEYPFGEEPFAMADSALRNIAIRSNNQTLVIAAVDSEDALNFLRVSRQTNLLSAFTPGGGGSFSEEFLPVSVTVDDLMELYIDESLRWVYLINDQGLLDLLDIRSSAASNASYLLRNQSLLESGRQIRHTVFLLGGLSLLVVDDTGETSQWFTVRESNQVRLEKVRSFQSNTGGLLAITPEQRRKNFATLSDEGYVAIYNTTAEREVFHEQIASGQQAKIAISPRGDALLLVSSSGEAQVWEVHNEHPEVSVSALWKEVWYESYPEPDYIWQSSSASNDFEPKYSLIPLSFGTLKAAFYAMLLATPLAICGAIFTGYFMAPLMRRKVKPLIELMEALPTVVLGFLAGLWLAPFVERNLLGVFAVLIILPLSILAASFLWFRLPAQAKQRIPEGMEAGLLLPVILLFGYLSFEIATPIETLLFAGDLRFWISTELGVDYDQRNAMVVGFAMGFAVIPTIFSIAEDAVFTVPKQLTYGSLALGATPWQSLQRVVLPTASPGIFSGVMIGFGRAVGETMIVLMATGNTPIMDINIFEGMRTLAANIAVEIPESEVDSTHYRILFLAALVLFMFTFIFNSIAEVVRQRLRSKYSTI